MTCFILLNLRVATYEFLEKLISRMKFLKCRYYSAVIIFNAILALEDEQLLQIIRHAFLQLYIDEI